MLIYLMLTFYAHFFAQYLLGLFFRPKSFLFFQVSLGEGRGKGRQYDHLPLLNINTHYKHT
jgi:hypothetical protein